MVRKARIVLDGQTHLIVQRVRVERVPLFRSDWSYQSYLSILKNLLGQYQIRLYAYVLLSDRVYLLLQPHEGKAIGALLQAHTRFFVPTINNKMNWQGSLWRDRFSCAPVAPEWVLPVMQFVDLFAVVAGLVGAPGIYRWSSYAHHVGQQSSSMLDVPQAFLDLAQNMALCEIAYQQLCEQPLDRAAMREIEQRAMRSHVLGSAADIASLEQKFGRGFHVRPRGRPKK